MSHHIETGGDGCRTRKVTGWTVLVCLVAFFGVIFAVNAVMIRVAVSSFGGLETESSYQAGLDFEREAAAARAQAALHWQIDARLSPLRDDATRLAIDARDADGRPLTGLLASARLVRPTDAQDDRAIALHETRPGVFAGSVVALAGQWDLVLELRRDGVRLFRSRNRVVLR
jgi:nitrogen fixation protein FixH